jgi:monothiol bacilliredoxin
MITVQSHRRVSDHATRRLGIRHETPQVILLRDGQPVWSASHFRVTADELDRNITA